MLVLFDQGTLVAIAKFLVGHVAPLSQNSEVRGPFESA
jgi:hypothetical protein